jgi:ribosomal protein S18 acetylase RimI-like enzyme
MIVQIQDKEMLFNLLKKDVFLYAYHIGDLDDFFFPDCIWFGIKENGELKDVLLLFTGLSIPTLLVFGSPEFIPTLINGIINVLPSKFYCHYQKEFEKCFQKEYEIKSLGTHLKMKFGKPLYSKKNLEIDDCIQLNEEDGEDLLDFYQIAYPNGYFESYMLQTGKYYGIKIKNKIQSVAGVHVYSEYYSIAVLGNIATLPSTRGRRFATRCIIRLIESFESGVKIGLNVRKDNHAAVNLYEKLGFLTHTPYEEGLFEIKG